MRVAFDFDGTLVDSMPALSHDAITLMTRFYGVPDGFAHDAYWSTVGRSFREQLHVIFPWNFKNVLCNNEFLRRQADAYELVRAFAPAVRTLAALDCEGVNLYVVSSSHRALTVPVAEREFPRVKLTVMGREYGTKLKQLRDLAPDLFVGDAPHDGRLARELNLNFTGVEHTFDRKRFEDDKLHSVKSISDILPGALATASLLRKRRSEYAAACGYPAPCDCSQGT